MNSNFTRRSVLAGGTSCAVLATALPSKAQDKPKLRMSITVPESDLRVEAFKAIGGAMKDDFDMEIFYNSSLFKQGTDLTAMQRENLELSNIAPADVAKQIPAWSLLTSAYLFRDYNHVKKTFKSDVGKEFIKMAREQVGIEVLAPVYFGARQINLRTATKISTPADMAGIKLRMPAGEVWQFLGASLGANPTPVAYAELYTSLQTGSRQSAGLGQNYEVL